MRAAWGAIGVVLAALLMGAESRGEETKIPDTANEFFTGTNLLKFQVRLDERAFETLADQPKRYVSGQVQVGDHLWEEVGIRLKGSGTFQPVYDHPSLALKFNWKRAEERFAGLPKLFLENSGQDATRMCKLIANAAYTEAGLAAPRITQARVVLNGRDLGVYVVAEAINRNFLKHHYGDDTGNLYEADFRDINRSLKQANGTPGNQDDLRAICRATALTNRTERVEAMNQVLDVEEFLNFLAVEMILANWDGYAFQQNNYRLYHNPVTGRMTFIPHDLDNTLAESTMSLMPPRNGILTAALMDSSEQRRAFRERVAKLAPKVLDPQKTSTRVQASVARLTEGAPPERAALVLKQAALIEQRVAERLEHIRAEIAGQCPPTPAFDSSGVAHLSGWAAKPDWNDSQLKMEMEDETVALSIQAQGGYCFASWRLPVWLPAGRYRLQGDARASDVSGLPSQTGSGVGVRVIGTRRGSGLQGNCSRWTSVRHDFTVQQGCEWVELIAELRAFEGTAWFDPETLRLIKVR